jgi:cytochrome b6-f complex iron-sulfur subunit
MKTHNEGAPRSESEESCGGCPVASSRRVFLRDVGLAVAAAVGAVALSRPARAFATSIEEIGPMRSSQVARTYAIPASDGVFIDADNEVILARWENRVYAFSLKCPHKGTRLEWRATEQRVFCPKHKARFLASGAHLSGRGSRDLDRYAIRRAQTAITVDLGTLYRQDLSRAAWEAAVVVL